MRKLILPILLLALLYGNAFAAAPSRIATYTTGTTISSSDVTSNEDAIFNYLQGGVDTIKTGTVTNDHIVASAGIPVSKLNLSTIATDITFSGDNIFSGTSTISEDMTFDDGVLLDLSGVNGSVTTEGLLVPQATSCASSTAEGQVCWDTDNDVLYVGDATAASAVVEYDIGTFTWDSTSDTDKSVTGVGFTPRYVMFIMSQAAGSEWSVGFDNVTKAYAVGDRHNNSADTLDFDSDDSIVSVSGGGSNTFTGNLKSLDSDGFTIQWVDGDTSTGTLSIGWMAFK